MNIIDFLTTVLSNAAVLVGLISMLGLLALKKPFGQVLSGTLKTIIGFIILGGGAGIVVGAVDRLLTVSTGPYHPDITLFYFF